jgi:hypothetical protein
MGRDHLGEALKSVLQGNVYVNLIIAKHALEEFYRELDDKSDWLFILHIVDKLQKEIDKREELIPYPDKDQYWNKLKKEREELLQLVNMM